jgi:excisionase family DNA binding protein
MKLELESHDAQAIAQMVAELLKRDLAGIGTTPSDIMDVESLADYLKVSKDWVYKQVQYKTIPHFKAGKFPRFKRREVDDWIKQQSTPATKPAYPKLKAYK